MRAIRNIPEEGCLIPTDTTVIIPAYNEVESIEQCVRGVVDVLSGVGKPFEVIVVDDGSNDGTGEMMRKLRKSDTAIHLISHSHNLGKTEAIKSGLAKSTGEIVVLMDADLQYDP